ncbi:MAG: alpha/beta hydrolase [Anaerolineae bacterium]|nr:alpha/beta hydrolase [Anaerolineae bacterium]
MTNWTDEFVETNGITMHYMRTGGDKPPVVLCHGFSDNGACWTSLAKSLEEDYDVSMIDARCHGQSSAPASGNDAETRAADLAGFIEALGLDKPVVAGHSMGAQYTQVFAAKYPHLLRGLILEDPPWMDPKASPPRHDRKGWQEQFEAFKKQSLEEGIAACETEHPNWEAGTCALFFRAKLELNFNVFKGVKLDLATWQESLPGVSCPVLIFTGDPELGAIVTDGVFDIAKSLTPQVERVHIPGVGHHIRYAEPQPYTQAFKAFLFKVFC